MFYFEAMCTLATIPQRANEDNYLKCGIKRRIRIENVKNPHFRYDTYFHENRASREVGTCQAF